MCSSTLSFRLPNALVSIWANNHVGVSMGNSYAGASETERCMFLRGGPDVIYAVDSLRLTSQPHFEKPLTSGTCEAFNSKKRR